MKTSKQFILMMALCLTICSCSILRPSQARKAEKKQQKIEKQADGEYQKAVNQHYKNQSDTTKKMMKKSKKRSTILNAPKLRRGKAAKKCDF